MTFIPYTNTLLEFPSYFHYMQIQGVARFLEQTLTTNRKKLKHIIFHQDKKKFEKCFVLEIVGLITILKLFY